MTYIVYYDQNNKGNIVSISPAILPNLEKKYCAFKIDDAESIPFINGTEFTSAWFVDFSKEPILIKKDLFVCSQYNEGAFFDVEKQTVYKSKIKIIIKKNTVVIKRHDYDYKLTFYLTKKDNPQFLLDKLILEPLVDEKMFITESEDFSIFSVCGFGSIEIIRE